MDYVEFIKPLDLAELAAMWDKLSLEWTLVSGLTVKVRNHGEWIIYNDIFVDREYDLPIQRALEAKPKGRPFVYLDLGANVGFFTFKVADYILQSEYKEVEFKGTLIEGSPAVYSELQSRLEAEPFFSDQLTLVHALIGERLVSGEISETHLHVRNSVIADNNVSSKVGVPYIDLDTLTNESREIDLIKADIEGSELRLLENYPDLLQKAKFAVIEVHYDMCDVSRCFDLLRQAGFTNHQQLRAKSPAFSLEFFWK